MHFTQVYFIIRSRSRIMCMRVCQRSECVGDYMGFSIHFTLYISILFESARVQVHFAVAAKCAIPLWCTTSLLSKKCSHSHILSACFNNQTFFIWILNVPANCFAAYINCSSANWKRCALPSVQVTAEHCAVSRTKQQNWLTNTMCSCNWVPRLFISIFYESIARRFHSINVHLFGNENKIATFNGNHLFSAE